MKPAARLFFSLFALCLLTSAYGCSLLTKDQGPTRAVSSADEEKIASGRYNDELAYGKSLDESLRINIESAKIYDEIYSVKALPGEKLVVVRLVFENTDAKDHEIPIAGFTFAGDNFDVPSASAIDQEKVPESIRLSGGRIQPGQTMRGNLVTRMPSDRMGKPFLFGIWIDQKQQIWTEMCARSDDLAQAAKENTEPLPKCNSDIESKHRLIHVKI